MVQLHFQVMYATLRLETVDQCEKKITVDIMIADLQKQIEESYTPKPVFKTLHKVFDARKWLGDNRMHGHSKPLSFKFTNSEEGVLMQYRDRSTDPWQQVPGEDIILQV